MSLDYAPRSLVIFRSLYTLILEYNIKVKDSILSFPKGELDGSNSPPSMIMYFNVVITRVIFAIKLIL